MCKDKTIKIRKARKCRDGMLWNKRRSKYNNSRPKWSNQIYTQGIWSWKQRINIDNKDTIHANAAKEKEQKSNQLNTVTTEHKVQTTQWRKRSEQNEEQRVNNEITTRTCKESTGCREQERVSTDQLFYGCRSKEHKYKNVAIRMIYL